MPNYDIDQSSTVKLYFVKSKLSWTLYRILLALLSIVNWIPIRSRYPCYNRIKSENIKNIALTVTAIMGAGYFKTSLEDNRTEVFKKDVQYWADRYHEMKWKLKMIGYENHHYRWNQTVSVVTNFSVCKLFHTFWVSLEFGSRQIPIVKKCTIISIMTQSSKYRLQLPLPELPIIKFSHLK